MAIKCLVFVTLLLSIHLAWTMEQATYKYTCTASCNSNVLHELHNKMTIPEPNSEAAGCLLKEVHIWHDKEICILTGGKPSKALKVLETMRENYLQTNSWYLGTTVSHLPEFNCITPCRLLIWMANLIMKDNQPSITNESIESAWYGLPDAMRSQILCTIKHHKSELTEAQKKKPATFDALCMFDPCGRLDF
ncbi:MAG: hypothetical protein AB7F19_03670 [Candidatus Babeliales bacterium]